MRFLTLATAIATVVAVGLVAAPATASDATLKRTFLRGVAQIRNSTSAARLHDQLFVTRAKLSADRASTARGRRGRMLAIRGFDYFLRGVDEALVGLELTEAGDVAGAVAAARRAHRLQKTGVGLLRAAGRAFRVPVRLGKGW